MSADPNDVTLGMQISTVEREIRMRREVYGRRVGLGKMKQRDADIEIASMQAVLATLQRVKEGGL